MLIHVLMIVAIISGAITIAGLGFAIWHAIRYEAHRQRGGS